MTLREFFAAHPRAAVALSGGVDSAYLLYAAVQAGAEVTAYYADTPFQPAFERADAERLAAYVNAPLRILQADPLADPVVASNPPDRCYHCKRALFSAILTAAAGDGYTLVLDGTNASDDADDRPGMRALAELAVRSPLRECGLTKPEIRRLSREAGLFNWDKPAYACLATRIPAGTPITPALLDRTDRAEAYLRSLGFADLRVRYLNGAAKLQLRREQLPLLLERRQEILDALGKDYDGVLLDLEVRNG